VNLSAERAALTVSGTQGGLLGGWIYALSFAQTINLISPSASASVSLVKTAIAPAVMPPVPPTLINFGIFFGNTQTTANLNCANAVLTVKGVGNGIVNFNATNQTLYLNDANAQIGVSGSTAGNVILNNTGQILTVNDGGAKLSTVVATGGDQIINFNGAWNDNNYSVTLANNAVGNVTVNVLGGGTTTVNANNVAGPYSVTVNLKQVEQSVQIKDGIVNVTMQFNSCWINGLRYWASVASFRVTNYQTTLISGTGFYWPYPTLDSNAASYQEISVSHSSQPSDFDLQGAMPTQDYDSVRDGNDKISSLLVNEQEIFNPNYLSSKPSSDFYGDYKNDPTFQLDNMNQSNAWASEINSPSLAGYSSTASALTWDNSSNRDLAGAAYITTRAYQ
jgi:hypothetical protein